MRDSLVPMDEVVQWANSRLDLLRFAKLAFSAKLYNTVFKFMGKLMSWFVEPGDLTGEEQQLLLQAYLGFIQPDLCCLQIIKDEEAKNDIKSSEEDEGLILFKKKTNMGIMFTCVDMSDLLDVPLRYKKVPKSSKAFYYTLKGDCYWNIFKVIKAPTGGSETYYYDIALKYYKQAQGLIGEKKVKNEDMDISDATTSDLLNKIEQFKQVEQNRPSPACEKLKAFLAEVDISDHTKLHLLQKFTQFENPNLEDEKLKTFLAKSTSNDKSVERVHLKRENKEKRDSSKQKREKRQKK